LDIGTFLCLTLYILLKSEFLDCLWGENNGVAPWVWLWGNRPHAVGAYSLIGMLPLQYATSKPWVVVAKVTFIT